MLLFFFFFLLQKDSSRFLGQAKAFALKMFQHISAVSVVSSIFLFIFMDSKDQTSSLSAGRSLSIYLFIPNPPRRGMHPCPACYQCKGTPPRRPCRLQAQDALTFWVQSPDLLRLRGLSHRTPPPHAWNHHHHRSFMHAAAATHQAGACSSHGPRPRPRRARHLPARARRGLRLRHHRDRRRLPRPRPPPRYARTHPS